MTKWRVFHEKYPGESRNYYHEWWIIAFIRAAWLLIGSYRVRIIRNNTKE